MDNKIASILFMPVCTKCLKIIWQTVDAKEERVDNGRPFIGSNCEIYPNKCPHCGTWFDHIVIPTKLPFNAVENLV